MLIEDVDSMLAQMRLTAEDPAPTTCADVESEEALERRLEPSRPGQLFDSTGTGLVPSILAHLRNATHPLTRTSTLLRCLMRKHTKPDEMTVVRFAHLRFDVPEITSSTSCHDDLDVDEILMQLNTKRKFFTSEVMLIYRCDHRPLPEAFVDQILYQVSRSIETNYEVLRHELQFVAATRRNIRQTSSAHMDEDEKEDFLSPCDNDNDDDRSVYSDEDSMASSDDDELSMSQ